MSRYITVTIHRGKVKLTSNVTGASIETPEADAHRLLAELKSLLILEAEGRVERAERAERKTL